MISRRIFGSCGLCAAMALIAEPAEIQAQATGGVTRRILGREDVPGSNSETIQVFATVEPGAFVARHTHPGIESSFVFDGEATLMVRGRPNALLRAGEGFMIPPETPHAVQNGGKLLQIAATYIVEKGKPLSTPAPE